MGDFYHDICIEDWSACEPDDWSWGDEVLCEELLKTLNDKPSFPSHDFGVAQKRKWDFSPRLEMGVNPFYMFELTQAKLNPPSPPPGQRRSEQPLLRHTLLRNFFKALTTCQDSIKLDLHSPTKKGLFGDMTPHFVFPASPFPCLDKLPELPDENLNRIETNELSKCNTEFKRINETTPIHERFAVIHDDTEQSDDMTQTLVVDNNIHRSCDLLLTNLDSGDSSSGSDSDSDLDTMEKGEFDCSSSCDSQRNLQSVSPASHSATTKNSCSYDQLTSDSHEEIESLMQVLVGI